jgi:hypothetical protein
MKLKIKREILFITIGIVLLFSVIGFIVYSIKFLVKNTGAALNQDSLKTKEITKFNFEGLKKLGIIK